MDRRHASKLILGSTLAAPALIKPSGLLAGPLKDHESDARIAEAARPVIRLAARKVFLEWFIVRTAFGWSAMNLQREFRQYSENRASLGGVLGGFQRLTVDQRLKVAQFAGTVLLLNNMLFMLPSSKIDPKAFTANLERMEFDLYHRYLSWDLEAAFRVVKLGNRSAESIRAEAKIVGVAYIVNELTMMLMVNPVLNKTYKGS